MQNCGIGKPIEVERSSRKINFIINAKSLSYIKLAKGDLKYDFGIMILKLYKYDKTPTTADELPIIAAVAVGTPHCLLYLEHNAQKTPPLRQRQRGAMILEDTEEGTDNTLDGSESGSGQIRHS